MTLYLIDPLAKPRMNRADKWKRRKVVLKYWAFKDECKLLGVHYEIGQSVTFTIKMPKSWSKKKQAAMNGQPHMVKPDIDNLLKALFDCVFEKDEIIWNVGGLKKLWGYNGSIDIF